VDKPSLMVLKSDTGSALKPALVIFPGGAFERVVVDKEGFDIARWYLRYGITCIIVKYRTSLQYTDDTIFQSIHADAQRAVQIVRSRAAEWSIDPNKIGIMGFSAGGFLAHGLLFDHGPGLHESYDAIGQVTFYPDFCCLVYAAWIPYHAPGDGTHLSNRMSRR
jgi:acetyl esterase/lipase